MPETTMARTMALVMTIKIRTRKIKGKTTVGMAKVAKM